MSATFLLTALLVAAPQDGPEPDPRLLERVVAEIEVEPAEGDPQVLAARLERLGPTVIPALFALLDADEIPPPEPSAEPRPLEANEASALLECLASFGRATLLPELDRRWLEPRSPLANTLAVLARIGSSADLEPLLDRVRERVPSGSLEHEAFQEAVTGILLRAPALAARVRRAILTAPEPLAADMVRALSGLAPEPACEALVALLGHRPPLDRTLLQALARIGPGLTLGSRESAAVEVRRYLHEDDEEGLLSAALLAAGGLRDHESLPRLVEVLDDPSGGVRGNARWALERISGRAFGNSQPRWTLWLESERQWHATMAPHWLEELRSSDYARAARALNELSQHDYRRDELAAEMCESLDVADARIRRQLCLALERLKSPEAVEALKVCLQDEDRQVAKAAWQALRAITGRAPEVDREAWRARGGGRG